MKDTFFSNFIAGFLSSLDIIGCFTGAIVPFLILALILAATIAWFDS